MIDGTFAIEDVAVGETQIIVSLQGRRFLFDGFSPASIARIGRLQAEGLLSTSQEGRALLTRIIATSEPVAISACPPRGFTIPARHVQRLASWLLPITRRPYSALVLFWSILSTGWLALWQPFFVRYINDSGFSALICTSAIYLISIAIHELGHATSLLKRTGLVGSISIRFTAFLPRVAVDVSSLHLAAGQTRGWIALSGPLAQMSFAGCCLILPYPPMQMGGYMALFGAVFSLLPLPGSDGFWALHDFSRDRIWRVYTGNDMRRKLFQPYTLFLSVILSSMLYFILNHLYLLLNDNFYIFHLNVLLISYAGLLLAKYLNRFRIFIVHGPVSFRSESF